MKKVILALIFLSVFCNFVYAEGIEIRKEYYANGNIQYERTYQNGVRHGLAIGYHENGNLFQEVEYVNGKKQGKYKQYNSEGILEQTFTYKDDEVDMNTGLTQKYFPNGKLAHEHNGSYMKQFEYFDDGSLKLDYYYDKEKRNGYRKEYHPNGQLSLEMIIKGPALYECKNYTEQGELVSIECPG